MRIDLILVGIEGIVLIIVAIGVVVTWNRNGKSAAKSAGIVEQTLTDHGKKLDETRQAAITVATSISTMETHCARVSSSLQERVRMHDRELDEMKHGDIPRRRADDTVIMGKTEQLTIED